MQQVDSWQRRRRHGKEDGEKEDTTKAKENCSEEDEVTWNSRWALKWLKISQQQSPANMVWGG